MKQARARSRATAMVAALIIVGILALVGAGCSKEEAGVVAKVNGKKIMEADVAKETQRLAMQMSGQVDPQQMQSMQGAFRKQAIDNMVSRMLLQQAVEKEGVTVASADVEARIGEIKKNFPAEQDFTNRLQQMGLTPDTFRQEIQSGMEFEALLAKHTGEGTPPTDAEVKAFYDQNPNEFQQPEQVRASHILVQFGKDDTEAQKKEKLAKITKIRNDIKGGADFAEMAKQYSDCPSKERGGDLGYFNKGQMVPQFDAAAFALKVGDLSDIVTTDFGYHIIRVADHKPARTVSLEDAKPDIVAYLENQQKQSTVNSYIEGLRAAAKIEYADTTGTGTTAK